MYQILLNDSSRYNDLNESRRQTYRQKYSSHFHLKIISIFEKGGLYEKINFYYP